MNLNLANFLTKELNFNLNNVELVEKLSGLNNYCYHVKYLNKSFFIRVANDSNNYNDNEEAIINLSSKYKLAPKLYYYDNITKNMALQWIDGRMPTETEFSSTEFIDKLVNSLKAFHNFKTSNSFNPFVEIYTNLQLSRNYNLELPYYIDSLLDKLQKIELYCLNHIDYGLCHNDLNPSNILISNNNLYLIDYEFSAMGDIFFDLATLSWMMTPDARENLLKIYFTNVTEYHYKKLSYYLFIVKLWNASWSLLKSQNNTSTYDYKTGAQMIFEDLWQNFYEI